MLDRDLLNRFTYHPPKEGQPLKYEEIRGGAHCLAMIVNDKCPESMEKTVAINHIDQAVMWANASIARNG